MKPTRARFLLGLTLVAVLLLVAVCLTMFDKSSADLPTYQGKTVEEWFFGPTGHPGLETTIKAAQPAFAAMGTNCVPYLLERLEERETGLNRFYCWIHPKLPSKLQSHAKPPIRASYIQMNAAMHLREMERKGTLSSLPDEPVVIVAKLADDDVRHCVFLMTVILAVRLDDVEQRKGFFLSFLDDPDFRIQLESAVMLSRVDATLTNGIPILLQTVTNNSFMASTFPAIAGSPQLPNQARIKQRTAHEALNKVAPELAEQHPVPD